MCMYSCIYISMYVYTYIHINTVMHRIAVTSSATIQYRQDASFCRYVELRNDFDDFAKKKEKKKIGRKVTVHKERSEDY